jgi:hypothetical protein
VEQTKNAGKIGSIDGYIGAARQWEQRFSYDSVGRLTQGAEYRGDNLSLTYNSNYRYDRYGNRAQPPALNQSSPFTYPTVELSDYNTQTNLYASGIVYDATGNITDDARFARTAARHALYRYDATGGRSGAATATTWER